MLKTQVGLLHKKLLQVDLDSRKKDAVTKQSQLTPDGNSQAQ